jgi:4-amino-4-deoxy-L-arabinose transferase-like glycosyltransferase
MTGSPTPIFSPLRKALFLFLFSLATHLPGITSPLLDFHGWAQTLRASTARNYYEHGMKFFHPEVDYVENWDTNSAPQFPLYSYLVALIYQAAGPNDAWGRVLSAFFAAWTSVLLYFFARRFVGELAGFWGGLVFSVLPISLYFTRAVMPDSMAVFCFVAGLYAALKWTEREAFWPWGVGSCLALTLSFLLKLAYLPLALAPAWLVWRRWGWGLFKRPGVWLFLGLFGLAYFGWYGTANDRIEVAHKGSFWMSMMKHTAVFQEWSKPDFWTGHFLSRFPELLTTYAGLLFFFAGFFWIWKSGERVLPVWFASTVVYILLCGNYGRVHQYVSLPFAPVNAVIIGAGIAGCWARWKSRRSWAAVLVVLVVSIPVHSVLRIAHWYRLDEQWVLRARDLVAEKTQPGDLLYVDAFDLPFYLYHLHRRGYMGEIAKSRESFERALAGGAKVFFSPAGGSWQAAEPELSRRFRLIYRDSDFVLYDLTRAPEGNGV